VALLGTVVVPKCPRVVEHGVRSRSAKTFIRPKVRKPTNLVDLPQLAVRVQRRASVIRVHSAVQPRELRAPHGRGAADAGICAGVVVSALGLIVRMLYVCPVL